MVAKHNSLFVINSGVIIYRLLLLLYYYYFYYIRILYHMVTNSRFSPVVMKTKIRNHSMNKVKNLRYDR